MSAHTTINPAEIGVQWQQAGLAKTNRGKFKAVLTGVPTPLFWRRWRAHGSEIRAALNLTIKKHTKGQWEAIAWLNKNTALAFTQLVERVNAGAEADGKPKPIATQCPDLFALLELALVENEKLKEEQPF